MHISFPLLFPFLWAQVNHEYHERIGSLSSSISESAFFTFYFTVQLGLERKGETYQTAAFFFVSLVDYPAQSSNETAMLLSLTTIFVRM